MEFSSFYKKIKDCAIRSKKDNEESRCETPLQDQVRLPELSPFCDHRAWEGLLPPDYPFCLLPNRDSTNESSSSEPIEEDEEEPSNSQDQLEKESAQSEKQGSSNDDATGETSDATGGTIPPLTLNYELLAQMAQARHYRRRHDAYISLNGGLLAGICEPGSFDFSYPQWRYHQQRHPRTFLPPSVLYLLGNTQPSMFPLLRAQLDMSPLLYDQMRDARYRMYQQLNMNNDKKMI